MRESNYLTEKEKDQATKYLCIFLISYGDFYCMHPNIIGKNCMIFFSKYIFLCLYSSFYIYFIFTFKVDKALQSMEEEAERIYKDERGMLLDDEAASTRDAM